MNARIAVWTLAWDTREGTDCKVFATEHELHAHMAQIVRDNLTIAADEEAKTICGLLDSNAMWEAWEAWCEKFKEPLDTYNWDRQFIEVEFSEAEQPVSA